jgi:hypothetical protein
MAGSGVTVTVPLGSTYSDGTAGSVAKTSKTVNFDWGPDDLPLIMSIFIQVLGLQLEDEFLVQVGAGSELKAIQ